MIQYQGRRVERHVLKVKSGFRRSSGSDGDTNASCCESGDCKVGNLSGQKHSPVIIVSYAQKEDV